MKTSSDSPRRGAAGARWRAALVAALWWAGVGSAWGFDWQLYKVGEREYLSFEQIGEFYSFSQMAKHGERSYYFSDGTRSLQIALGSQTAMINGVKHWLSFPVIVFEGKPLLSRLDLAKTLEPLMRPRMIQSSKNFTRVVLDPGHGGMDNGAKGRWSPDEKTLTLDVAKRLRPLLEAAGLEVVLTRSRDVFVPLEERARISTLLPNSVFVSIHFNSGDRSAYGVETYALSPRGTPSSSSSRTAPADFDFLPGHATDSNNIVLASSISRRLAMARGNDAENRGVRRARFLVLKDNAVPSALLECGFLSNAQDAARMADPTFRQGLAVSIRDGIMDYRSMLHGLPGSEAIFAMASKNPVNAEAMLAERSQQDTNLPVVEVMPKNIRRMTDALPPVSLPQDTASQTPAKPAPFRPPTP